MDERAPSDRTDRDPQPDRGARVGIPRWVKIFAAIGVVLVVLIVVALLAGHGPGRHLGHGMGQVTGAGVAGTLR